MKFDRQTPTFNLKAVVQETGLKPDTLRAWERRYGLPAPERSDGGHRLYAQTDIDTLKWLMERQNEGMSISRAVELWRHMEGEGVDPLTALQPEPNQSRRPVGETPDLGRGGALVAVRQSWIAACLAFDEQQASTVLAQAFAYYPPEVVCLDVLMQGQALIGDGWHRGQVTVQQEHFTSALALRRLEALLAATPPPTRPDRILVACPPHEEHTFVPLLLTLLLRRRGLDVIYLGADVPLTSLRETLVTAQPQLVVLTAQQLFTAANLLEMAEALLAYRIPAAYGGLIFSTLPALRHRIPGHHLGDRLEKAPYRVEELLCTATSLPPAYVAVEPHYRSARYHFAQHRAAIEADLWQQADELAIEPAHMARAVTQLALNVDAALGLGEMDFLHHELRWVRTLLANFGEPTDSLHHFLARYHTALVRHLDERGAPVTNWFARLLASAEPAQAE